MANSDLDTHTTSVKDVKQLGIWAAIGSLGYVFWVCGAMEMVERLAYYGVRQVSSLYATDAQSNGGLGLPGTEIGIIFLVWAMVQSFVPVLTGGIPSSRLPRAHSTPMPVGPSILCPLKATKSAPSACTSVGACGTLCAASTSKGQPENDLRNSSSGWMTPLTFEAC